MNEKSNEEFISNLVHELEPEHPVAAKVLRGSVIRNDAADMHWIHTLKEMEDISRELVKLSARLLAYAESSPYYEHNKK